MVASTDATDDGAMSVADTVTAAYIAADLRALAVPIETLQHAPDNARKHADADLDPLTDGFRTFGQVKPFVGKRTYRGLRDVILCGNGGLVAARRLGWRYVAVAWLPETTTDDDARRLAVLDNRLAELSRWDAEALAALAAADGVDLLALWHDDAALADLLGADAPAPKFQPEAPAHRLDELADNTTCPACGHRWHQERR